MNIDGACVPNDETHNKCVITGDGRIKTVCNNRGIAAMAWTDSGSAGATSGPSGHRTGIAIHLDVFKGVVCSGRGTVCLTPRRAITPVNVVVATQETARPVLKSGLVATSVIVPLLIIGAVAGFLCWWFLCHKKNGGNCFGGGGGSKPKRGKAIRLSDGDSLSVQSGISGFTSQL